MQLSFNDVTLAILCGDSREVFLAESLVKDGFTIRAFGLPLEGKQGIIVCRDIQIALEGAQAVILPVPGINDKGQLYSAFIKEPQELTIDMLSSLPKKTPVLVGSAKKNLAQMTAELGLQLVEVMKRDDVAILNSIPSAEGAIQMAMNESNITIHGSSSIVLGFGRTGMTLARKLKALDSRVVVVARNPSQRARAIELGVEAIDFQYLETKVVDIDFIFNTVPDLIIDKALLLKIHKQAIIIDLASAPGGVDFKEAERLGIKAILAPGLPGKVAPLTAGRILAQVIPGIIAEKLGLS